MIHAPFRRVGFASAYAPSGSSYLTTVTAGSAHVKGSWVEFFASTSFDVDALVFNAFHLGGTYRVALFDIGVGAAGSEVVKISNIMMQADSEWLSPNNYPWPVAIPAGSRIAVRCQSATGGAATACGLFIARTGQRPVYQEVLTYGADTGTSQGVAVDPGAVANTKGAWAQLVASTTAEIRALMVKLGIGSRNGGDGNLKFDIGVGPGGSEVVVVSDIPFIRTLSDRQMMMTSSLFRVDIPAGTRLAARAQCDSTNVTTRTNDCIVYGLR